LLNDIIVIFYFYFLHKCLIRGVLVQGRVQLGALSVMRCWGAKVQVGIAPATDSHLVIRLSGVRGLKAMAKGYLGKSKTLKFDP
jgi:hypothetical protein